MYHPSDFYEAARTVRKQIFLLNWVKLPILPIFPLTKNDVANSHLYRSRWKFIAIENRSMCELIHIGRCKYSLHEILEGQGAFSKKVVT